MRSFAEAWPEESIVQQVVGQIPWGHNVRLLDLVKTTEERLWYAQAAVEHGWSRNVLAMQIEGGLYRRQGKALTNFSRTLLAPQSDLAQQLLKDPYNFDFLTLSQDAQERDLSTGTAIDQERASSSLRFLQNCRRGCDVGPFGRFFTLAATNEP